ncbi:MaoC-like dehydratase domain-containing protein [Cavenderia fasciculata]|uniref:MaoC-like dehydratase domain-containing protein n=1 Tax=Cavenderia fasciculata TaxID=261658 RepID=F4PTM9_CACFS|nr:MaoC-like dehydratase domain-containing protein [Cavenderia fasciculata]EGG21699.1 MaoC-like dehydratase domain-containing protein [Cavenderia fasciculata]|eukprot:XP_004359549.1 MaoC-like dehydratase domain-containing protein [Cavenderia fasciculata]
MDQQQLRRIQAISSHLTANSELEACPTSATSLPELAIRAQTQRNALNTKTLKGLEELKTLIGKDIGISDYLKITQDRVNDFAAATGDFQWIHVDPERAKEESPFGGPIAHGFLTLSLAPMFAEEIMPNVEGVKYGVNMGFNKVRFLSPVPIGAKVRCKFTLQDLQEVTGGAQAVIKLTFEVEDSQKPAAICEWLIRYYSATSYKYNQYSTTSQRWLLCAELSGNY